MDEIRYNRYNRLVYAGRRRSIFSIGGCLGSKSAFFFEILSTENGLFLDEKPSFLENPVELSNNLFN
jgi:hypothetical protein